MQAFEFNSVVEKGNIRIPDKYLDKIQSPVKVIILSQENQFKNIKKKFNALSLDTRGFRFDKDEANER